MTTDDNLLDWDDDETTPVDANVTDYEKYLLSHHKEIIDKALNANPDDTNTTINQLLRSLTTLKKAEDRLELPQELLNRINGEQDVSEDIKEVVYGCLRGEITPVEAKESLDILSVFFQTVKLPELIEQINRLAPKSGSGTGFNDVGTLVEDSPWLDDED